MTPVYKFSDSRNFAGTTTYYSSMLAGNEAFSPSSDDFLEEVILTSSASSFSFTGLDAYTDYKHLQIRAVVRTDRATTGDVIDMTLNGDSGANYAYHDLTTDSTGATLSASGSSSTSFMRFQRVPGATQTADVFGAVIFDILDFSSTSKNTTIRHFAGFAGNTYRLGYGSGVWNDTSAVTSLQMDILGSNFVAGCRFSLYGSKG